MATSRRPWQALILSLLMTAAAVAAILDRPAPLAWAAVAFFALCTLVLLVVVVAGAARRRVGGSQAPARAAAPVAPFPPEELARRRPVWRALSNLFLDTELQASDHVWIARALRDSAYDDTALLAILDEEVAPVCGPNLLSVAGEWAGFDHDWLEGEILKVCAARGLVRRTRRLGRGLARRAVREDLRQVMAALVRLRRDPAALARSLREGPPRERAAAARDLAFLGRDSAAVAAAVRAACGDPDPEVRMASLDAAWRIERLGALDAVLRAAGDADPAVRRASVVLLAEAAVDPSGLGRTAPAVAPAGAIAAAEALLREADPAARQAAATALGVLAALGATSALEPVLAALDEEAVDVRVAIGRAAALGGAGEIALAPVVPALADARPGKRRTAAQVLASVAQRQGAAARWAVAPLLAAARGADPVVRRLAVVGLGWTRAAAAEARPLLLEGASHDGDPEVRGAFVLALARVDAALGAPPLDMLLAALESSGPVRTAAYAALFELGAAASPLLPRLQEMALEKGSGKALDRRVAAKVLIDRIRERSAEGGGPR